MAIRGGRRADGVARRGHQGPDRRPGPLPEVHRPSDAAKSLNPVADYEAARSATALIATYDLGEGAVHRLLRDHGVGIQHRPVTVAEATSSSRCMAKECHEHESVTDLHEILSRQRRPVSDK